MKKKPEAIVQASTEEGQRVGEAIVEAVENQLKENKPPETRITLARLLSLGESRENAMRYIGSVYSMEIFEVMKNKTPYNETRYIENLKALPELPAE